MAAARLYRAVKGKERELFCFKRKKKTVPTHTRICSMCRRRRRVFVSTTWNKMNEGNIKNSREREWLFFFFYSPPVCCLHIDIGLEQLFALYWSSSFIRDEDREKEREKKRKLYIRSGTPSTFSFFLWLSVMTAKYAGHERMCACKQQVAAVAAGRGPGGYTIC